MEAGSVGLIMENRPNNLPAKTVGEQLKHKQEYQRMVSAAKKKGIPSRMLMIGCSLYIKNILKYVKHKHNTKLLVSGMH